MLGFLVITNKRAFGLDKPAFLQTLFKTSIGGFEDERDFFDGIGKLFQKENTKENNLFGSWSRIMANNCFGYN